jgi:hypothetical protein
MAHRDGLPRLLARSVRRGDAGHWKTRTTRPFPILAKSLDDVPHRLQLPSYPTGCISDLYGSLLMQLGMTAEMPGTAVDCRVISGLNV